MEDITLITDVIGVKITFPLQTYMNGQLRTIEIYTSDGNSHVFKLLKSAEYYEYADRR